jgi:hypothetical protein
MSATLKNIIIRITHVSNSVREGAFTPEANARELDLSASLLKAIDEKNNAAEAKLKAIDALLEASLSAGGPACPPPSFISKMSKILRGEA